MFCNSCGKELQPGHQFCASCGQPVGVAAIPQSANRVKQNLQMVAVLWIIYSLLHLLAGFGMLVMANVIFGHLSEMQVPNSSAIPVFLQPLLSGIAIFIVLTAVLGIAAGWGLMKHQAWARILAIVMSFFALLNIPIGTALGGYTLWVLLPSESHREYAALEHAHS